MDTFYDTNGKPIAYTEDGENVFLFSGEPVAYFFDDLIYSFNGINLGRYEDGWIRDLEGYCVFYSDNSEDVGPVRPVKKVKPVKHVKRSLSIKSVKKVAHPKPVNHRAWSDLSGVQFFKNT